MWDYLATLNKIVEICIQYKESDGGQALLLVEEMDEWWDMLGQVRLCQVRYKEWLNNDLIWIGKEIGEGHHVARQGMTRLG